MDIEGFKFFSVDAGKFLALVGHTGAGKSSIIRILNRFYEIEKGKFKLIIYLLTKSL